MAQHILSLDIPEIINPCILRVVDTSVYNPQMTAVCPLLQITLPGFTTPVQFTTPDIDLGFSLNLTACDLGLQTTNCNTKFVALMDGIYIIKYSVSPNEIVYVEYNHLRISDALNKLSGAYCDLDLAACAPNESVAQRLKQLQLIEQYLKAAKAMVEYCHQPSKGMELYKYALKLLNKLTCTNC